MSDTPGVVIDSNLALFSVVLNPLTAQARQVLHHLEDRRTVLYAPRLWSFEVTSALHKYLFDRLVTREIADKALAAIFKLPITLIGEDLAMCRSAFEWATRLGQKAAYDSFYLAAAERLSAEFWTADEKLYNRAKQIQVSWIHWMGELA